MKKSHIVLPILAIYVFLSGCATSKTLVPVTYCKSLAKFDAVAIVPFNTDSVISDVQLGSSSGTLKGIADSISDRLKNGLQQNRTFEKIVQSNTCPDRSIKIDGKIIALTHHRGKFHIQGTGTIMDCKSGEPLYRFEFDEDDSELNIIPNQIAEKIVSGINGRLTCP